MKRLIILLSVVFAFQPVHAQSGNEITWFGIDFSKAKMIGSAGFNNAAQIQSYYLDNWNSVVVTEVEKYNISRFYKYPTVNVFLDVVKERNSKVEAGTLVTEYIQSFGRRS